MRGRHKEWQNDRGGKWTARIIWYQGDDIRLKCETPEGVYNEIFQSEVAAQAFWDSFKKQWAKEKK